MVASVALCVLGTRSVLGTRVHTTAVAARATIRTIVIGAALDTSTRLEGIALQAWGALTISLVVVSIALGGHGTRVTNHARVHAFAVVALLVRAALVVRRTLTFDASDLRITGISGFARAHTVVIDDATIGVLATQAGTAAQAIDTRLGWGTVGIGRALGGGFGGWGRDERFTMRLKAMKINKECSLN